MVMLICVSLMVVNGLVLFEVMRVRWRLDRVQIDTVSTHAKVHDLEESLVEVQADLELHGVLVQQVVDQFQGMEAR